MTWRPSPVILDILRNAKPQRGNIVLNELFGGPFPEDGGAAWSSYTHSLRNKITNLDINWNERAGSTGYLVGIRGDDFEKPLLMDKGIHLGLGSDSYTEVTTRKAAQAGVRGLLTGILSVNWFGAVPDGTTNCGPAIANAIAVARDSLGEDPKDEQISVIYFPKIPGYNPSVYMVEGGAIELYGNLHLISEPGVIIKLINPSENTLFDTPIHADWPVNSTVQFSNMALDCGGVTGINIEGGLIGMGVLLEDVTFYNSNNDQGAIFTDSRDFMAKNLTFINCKTIIQTTGSECSGIFRDSLAMYSDDFVPPEAPLEQYVINVAGGEDGGLIFRNVHILNPFGAGYHAFRSRQTNGVTFVECSLRGDIQENFVGIVMDDARYNIVSRCKQALHNRFGLDESDLNWGIRVVAGAGGGPARCVVTFNQVITTRAGDTIPLAYGIDTRFSSGQNVVGGNIVQHGTRVPFSLYEPTDWETDPDGHEAYDLAYEDAIANNLAQVDLARIIEQLREPGDLEWEPIGHGVTGGVRTVHVAPDLNDMILVGGTMKGGGRYHPNDTPEDTNLKRIAKWAFGEFQRVGLGTNGNVNKIITVGKVGYVGGSYRDVAEGANPAPAIPEDQGLKSIAISNDEFETLEELGGGVFLKVGGSGGDETSRKLSGFVQDVIYWDKYVVITGNFRHANHDETKKFQHVAFWDTELEEWGTVSHSNNVSGTRRTGPAGNPPGTSDGSPPTDITYVEESSTDTNSYAAGSGLATDGHSLILVGSHRWFKHTDTTGLLSGMLDCVSFSDIHQQGIVRPQTTYPADLTHCWVGLKLSISAPYFEPLAYAAVSTDVDDDAPFMNVAAIAGGITLVGGHFNLLHWKYKDPNYDTVELFHTVAADGLIAVAEPTATNASSIHVAIAPGSVDPTIAALTYSYQKMGEAYTYRRTRGDKQYVTPLMGGGTVTDILVIDTDDQRFPGGQMFLVTRASSIMLVGFIDGDIEKPVTRQLVAPPNGRVRSAAVRRGKLIIGGTFREGPGPASSLSYGEPLNIVTSKTPPYVTDVPPGDWVTYETPGGGAFAPPDQGSFSDDFSDDFF